MVVLKRAFVVALVLACKPDLGARESQIVGPRLLALRATPAEVETGDAVTYDALVVGPNGELGTALDYAYCDLRNPLDNPNTVAEGCVATSGDGIVEIGASTSVSTTMPDDACANFGPEVPPSKPGQPQGRPVDPDPTGGYYQPLRIVLGGEIDVGESRILCGLNGGSQQDNVTYNAQYHDNTNPTVSDVAWDQGSVSQDAGAPTAIPAGASITLTASWPACPTSDVCGDGVCGADESVTSCAADCNGASANGCAGAERYVNFDEINHVIITSRETIRIAWFATGGSFTSDGTGREGTDVTTSSSNTFTVPASRGAIHAWAVIHDDRGGVGWRRFELVAQ
jgi:hypothetical protein